MSAVIKPRTRKPLTRLAYYLSLLSTPENKLQDNEQVQTSHRLELKKCFENIEIDIKQFNLDEFIRLLPLMYIAQALEKNGQAVVQAAKLIIALGTCAEAIDYLKKFEKRNKTNTLLVHDACLFSLPRGNQWDLNLWQHLCRTYLHDKNFKELFARAPDIEGLMKQKKRVRRLKTNAKQTRTHASFQSIKINTLLRYYHVCRYSRAKENIDAAKLYIKQGMSEDAFNTYLDLPKQDSSIAIPKVFIEDRHYPGFYLMKIEDERTGVLGKLTHCCQHLDDKQGRDCVIYGLTSKLSGFYALCEYKVQGKISKEDRVVAQTWAWRSKDGVLVLDSIERNIHKADEVLIADFFMRFAEVLVAEHQVPCVMAGAGGRTPKNLLLIRSHDPVIPTQYSGILDSREQYYLADKHLPMDAVYRATHRGLTQLTPIEIESKEKKETKECVENKELKESRESKRSKEALEKELQLQYKWVALCFISHRSDALPFIFDKLPLIPKDIKHLHLLYFQINQFYNLITTTNEKINFPLIVVLLQKNPMFQYFLNLKFNRDDVEFLRKTSILGLACYYGSAEVVARLLKMGATSFSLVQEDAQLMEPWELAGLRKKYDVLSLLLEHNPSLVHYCIDKLGEGLLKKNFEVGILQYFIQAGMNIHQKTKTGRTLLSIATACGNTLLLNEKQMTSEPSKKTEFEEMVSDSNMAQQEALSESSLLSLSKMSDLQTSDAQCKSTEEAVETSKFLSFGSMQLPSVEIGLSQQTVEIIYLPIKLKKPDA